MRPDGVKSISKALLAGDILKNIFPGSSAVEQLAVNELVAGSNPARGAR